MTHSYKFQELESRPVDDGIMVRKLSIRLTLQGRSQAPASWLAAFVDAYLDGIKGLWAFASVLEAVAEQVVASQQAVPDADETA